MHSFVFVMEGNFAVNLTGLKFANSIKWFVTVFKCMRVWFCRYNPENLKILEQYVFAQASENTYDLEANLAVLKL